MTPLTKAERISLRNDLVVAVYHIFDDENVTREELAPLCNMILQFYAKEDISDD